MSQDSIIQVNPDDCWLWASYTNDGYGIIAVKDNGKMHNCMAHKVMYENLRGPVPSGMVIDHLCRVRCCVNPQHMEIVTPGINTLRGYGPPAINGRKESCVNGHLLKGENLSMRKRTNRPLSRVCLTCKRISNRKYKRAMRAKHRPRPTINIDSL